MGSARGLAHQEDFRRIDADLIGVLLNPLDDPCDVFGGSWILRVARKPVTRIDSDDPVASKVAQYVGVDLFGTVRVAVQKRAAMHENHRGAPVVAVVGREQVDGLPRVRPIGDSAANGYAIFRSLLENFAELVNHQFDVSGRVGTPTGTDLRHQGAKSIGNPG